MCRYNLPQNSSWSIIVHNCNSTRKGQKKKCLHFSLNKNPANKKLSPYYSWILIELNCIALNTLDNRIWIESSTILLMWMEVRCYCMFSYLVCWVLLECSLILMALDSKDFRHAIYVSSFEAYVSSFLILLPNYGIVARILSFCYIIKLCRPSFINSIWPIPSHQPICHAL